MQNTRPLQRTLEQHEMSALLKRNQVGRLAFARGDDIEVIPINYVYADGSIYGRVQRGSRERVLENEWWPVSFEVDEVRGLSDWQSVVAHGSLRSLEQETPLESVDGRTPPIPSSLSSEIYHRLGDPSPQENVFFCISIEEMSGRESRPSSEERPESERAVLEHASSQSRSH